MKDTNAIGLRAIALVLALFGGCDDNGPPPPHGFDGDCCPVEDAGLPIDEDVGTELRCLQDIDCPDAEYCELAGELLGRCDQGCRQDGCAPGQRCDLNGESPTYRECRCADDTGCPDEQVCTGEGDCTEQTGCREGDPCPESDDDRAQTCVVPAGELFGECVEVFVCCAGEDMQQCAEGTRDACEGDVVTGAPDCSSDPCKATVCVDDTTCAPETYCNVEDGRCLDGCRTEPDSCADALLFCDPDKRDCVRRPCARECPPNTPADPVFCNEEGFCARGCEMGSCPADLTCVDGELCVDVGPRCESDDECLPGSWCDEVRGFCRDDCQEHDGCFDEEFCEPESERCVFGCRDDLPAYPTRDEALAIELPVDFNAHGYKIATVDGRRFCSDTADFFSVGLNQGERMQLQLIYPQDVLDSLNLALYREADEEAVAAEDGIENPKTVEFPRLGAIEPPTTYFAEVFGAVVQPAGVDYRVRVVVADADNPCFLDAREGAGGADDERGGATRQRVRLDEYAGTLCGDDEDWFVIALDQTDGLDVSLSAEGDDAEFLIYSAARLDQGGIGNPNHRSPDPVVQGAARRSTLELEPDQGLLGAGDWYVRVKTADPGGLAEYTLRIERVGGGDCGDDGGTEPNDAVVDAVDLRAERFGVAVDGALPTDEELPVDLELEICARDQDVFCFDAEAGDIVEAWTVGAGVAGDFVVQLLDAQGGAVGERGRNNRAGSANRARWRGANEGRVCVRVRGVEASQGPYSLFLRRLPGGEMCQNDVDEFGAARNDVASAATDMVTVVPGRRFEYAAGYLCDVQSADEDWYRFPIAEPSSAVCLMLDGFRDATADLDMSAFPEAPIGADCVDDEQCQNGGNDRSTCVRGFCAIACANAGQCAPEEACLAGRCTASPNNYFSRTGFDFEAKLISRAVLGGRAGEHFFRIDRGGAGAESAYTISATVSPVHPADECPRDFQELNGANDERAQAVALGAGQVGFCDAWICAEEEGNPGSGDWYEITVPANDDRTVMIEFASLPIDGRLLLDIEDPEYEMVDGMDFFGGTRRASNAVAGFQCINLRGGAEDRVLLVNVGLDTVAVGDPDGRVDYTFRAVPTDLDADPQGECLTFGAPDLGACDPDMPLQGEDCWPVYEIAP